MSNDEAMQFLKALEARVGVHWSLSDTPVYQMEPNAYRDLLLLAGEQEELDSIGSTTGNGRAEAYVTQDHLRNLIIRAKAMVEARRWLIRTEAEQKHLKEKEEAMYDWKAPFHARIS